MFEVPDSSFLHEVRIKMKQHLQLRPRFLSVQAIEDFCIRKHFRQSRRAD
jgi:hypothetical protein